MRKRLYDSQTFLKSYTRGFYKIPPVSITIHNLNTYPKASVCFEMFFLSKSRPHSSSSHFCGSDSFHSVDSRVFYRAFLTAPA